MPRRYLLTILIAAASLISVTEIGVLRAEPPALPRGDGAPGEGETPRFFVEPPAEPGQKFAQAPANPFLPNVEVAVEEADDGKDRLDDLDKRAGVRKGRQSIWTKATEAAGESDWDAVLRSLGEWHDRSADDDREDSLVRMSDGTLTSGRLAAARLLLQLPDEQRRDREDRVGGRARTQLDQAVRSGNLRDLAETASRYFGTLAGYDAANRLATRLLDGGDYALAARWLILLRDANSAFSRDPAWQKRTQLVLAVTGLEDDEDGPDESDRALASLAKTLIPAAPHAVENWLLPGGHASRHARTSGGKPVLFPRWTTATVTGPRLQESIDRLFEDLSEQRESAIPAALPICVDGKLISRTLRGIEVIDVETGRRLWTTAERNSVERILDGASHKQKVNVDSPVQGPFAWGFGVPGFDAADSPAIASGPLSQFLFQNAAQGAISSNGQLVYSVEDDPVLTLGRTSIRNSSGIDEGPEPGSATTNRLTATDLRTGRIAWQAGGPPAGAVFDQPLAGLFFMGAPVPAGDDLFVVALKEQDVRLYCLDPLSGEPRWSQLLAFSDQTPDRDLLRRIWSAQPAVAHGVVVCPTNVGWLVGVDRTTGTVLWTHRYSTKKRRLLTPSFDPFGDGGLTSMASEPVNSRWAATPPVIAGRRVYITPAESKRPDDPSSGMIVCVDLFSGRRLWQKSRGNGRYLAGVVDDLAVVVENDAVLAYGKTGRPQWDVDLPREVGAPSGRGVITESTLWLPTLNQKLVQIDLKEGRIAERFSLPEGSRPLGNLVMYRGKLISVHAAEITAFEQSAALQQRLATLRARGEHDPQIAMLDARLALSNDDAGRAINVLKNSLSTRSTPESRKELQALLSHAVLTNLERQPEASLSLIRELESLPTSGAESFNHRRLAIDVLLRTGHPDEAFSRLLKLTDLPASAPIPVHDSPHVKVSPFVWLRDRLATAWSQLDSEGQATVATQISERISSGSLSTTALSRHAQLFAFHPEIISARQTLMQTALENDQFAEANFRLSQMAESDDTTRVASALMQLVELHLDQFVDRVDLAELLNRAEHVATEADDKSLSSRLKELRTEFEKQAAGFESSDESRWNLTGQLAINATRTGGSHTKLNRFGIDTVQNDPPAGSRYRVEISGDGNARRLLLFERGTGTLAWSVILRGGPGNGRAVSLRRAGPLLFVLHRGMLQCLSIPDRRVLWSRLIELPDTPAKFPKVKPARLVQGAEWVAQVTGSPNDPLPITNLRFVCTRGRKTLTVLNALTGEVQWTLDPAPRTMRVVEHDGLLCLIRRDGEVSAAYEVTTGRPRPVPPKKIQTPFARFADRSVTASIDEAGETLTITSRRDGAGNADWTQEFEAGFSFSRVGRHTLAIMRDRGHFAVLDLQTGELLAFDRIPASLRIGKTQFQVLRDERRWYVVLSGETERDYRAPSLKSVSIAGHILAFDAETGTQLWKQSLSDQFLVIDRFSSLPVLLVLSPSSNPLGIPSERLGIQVLSKSSGDSLFEQTLPGMIPIHSMRLDDQSRMIELFASGDRIRVTIVPESP